ncbi:hypothetical protein H5410_054978 [Solanum commersonii]|uniref:Uncharacterized protein n=1 Tax=Solanum commersonii TaxID=4109 RepID=A0A9J5WHY8_SOLCO|nr:hypothetical protein H5410_054978 [Solanum commersonii]
MCKSKVDVRNKWEILCEELLGLYKAVGREGRDLQIHVDLAVYWNPTSVTVLVLPNPHQDTMSYLFLTSSIVEKLWRLFANFAGIHLDGLQLSQVIPNWWTTPICPKLKPILIAIPTIIIWHLWKRRNFIKK